MVNTDILQMLEDIGRTSTARLSHATDLTGDTANERRQKILHAIRGTILPRRLEFTAANGDSLAIEVNSSRITDIFRSSSGSVPDFETEPRDQLTSKLAQLVTDLAIAPGPLELISKRPDTALEADDVGITFSEIEAACGRVDLPDVPQVSLVPASIDETLAPQEDAGENQPGLAQRFYQDAGAFALGRAVFDNLGGSEPQFDGLFAPEAPAHPDQDILDRFTRDLAGWDDDTNGALSRPQMIVMRPAGGQGTGLALLRDGQYSSAALHDARKLGAVVNLWKSLKAAAE